MQKICSKGVWDNTIPGIEFDEKGVSNYAKLFDDLCNAYPRNTESETKWLSIIKKIKRKGKNKRYDCILGVSGGTDSCYLLYLAKKYGLRPLAVNLDNGWNSKIAVNNIKLMTSALNVDLETYVIDYEEVKSVYRAYFKATLPWVDGPTDLAIKAVLYKIARKEKVKYILNGSDFRSEGKQPTEWTYTDAKQLKFLVRKFEKLKIKTFPYNTLFQLLINGMVLNIKMLRPFYYLNYNKSTAQKFLIKEYKWEYYGEHHHENLFTKFIISYWLPSKFNIDKRKITYSAQILSGDISRKEALNIIQQKTFTEKEIEDDINLIIKKLELSRNEFEEIFNRPNKYYFDYPSYMPIYNKFSKYAIKVFKYILPFQPSILFERRIRNS